MSAPTPSRADEDIHRDPDHGVDHDSDHDAKSRASWPFDPSTPIGRSYLAVDWTATPLGTPSGWSDSLKSTVRMMLASRFSMWMGWGPELTFFCDDAYRRDSLGGKYPWALGRASGEVWSEIWDQLTDRVAAVTVAGESTWDEQLMLFVERSGYLEETYHTFSYSPLTEGDASIAGLLCVVSEVTDGVINARRMTTVSDLSAGLAEAATERDVCAAAQARIARNPSDFPFAAAYLVDKQGRSARLAWSCGIEPGRAATPDTLDLDSDSPWAQAAREIQTKDAVLLEDVGALFVDLAPGPEGIRSSRAVVAPITRAGAQDAIGFLVVAASAHRPVDEEYTVFIQLIAEQFAAALARARAFEAERDQAIRVAAHEHAIAQELQASLLPPRDFDADHLDIATFYSAGVEGTEVGGDWFDVIDLGPGRTALVIGDVMGRGVQAAAVMGQLRASVRAYARLELTPDAVLGLLDETVRELGDNKIVTCVYAVYDPAEHSLTYANAGHLPPLLRVTGAPTVALAAGGPPLGVGRSWPVAQTVTLPIGATLALYTDGLVERRGNDIETGIERMMRLLESPAAHVGSLPTQLVSELMPEGADDDIAVLVARVSDRAHLDRGARLELSNDTSNVSLARRFVATTLDEWQLSGEIVFDAQLIVSELVTNAYLHADSAALLTIRTTGTRLFLEIHDRISTAPRPRNALPSDTNGRGLAIVASIATRWGTRQTPAGKAVWCELIIRAA